MEEYKDNISKKEGRFFFLLWFELVIVQIGHSPVPKIKKADIAFSLLLISLFASISVWLFKTVSEHDNLLTSSAIFLSSFMLLSFYLFNKFEGGCFTSFDNWREYLLFHVRRYRGADELAKISVMAKIVDTSLSEAEIKLVVLSWIEEEKRSIKKKLFILREHEKKSPLIRIE